MNRIITALVVLAVVGVGAVAAFDGFGGDSTAADDRAPHDESGSRDLIGPHSPEPGALPGRLIVARSEACVIQLVDLRRLRFSKSGPESGCDFAVSADGALAAVAARGEAPEAPERRFELVALGDKPETQSGLGHLPGDPVWSPDGAWIASCDVRVSSETSVIPIDGGPRETLLGCWPRFGTDGRVVTRNVVDLTVELSSDGIYAGGDELITLDQLLAAAGGGPDARGFVLGHTSGVDGTTAVLIVHISRDTEAQASLQLWRDGVAITVVEISLFADERGITQRVTSSALRDVMRLSPDGSELGIVLHEGAGPLFVVDVETGETLGPLTLLAYDWSPDGRWLAVANGAGIDVYGPARDDAPTFQLPLATPALAWR